MLDEELVADLERELADALAERDRIASPVNPHVDRHKVPRELAVLDKWIDRYQQRIREAHGG